MNTIFYCFGFVYLIDIIYELYLSVKPYKKENITVIDGSTDVTDLHSFASKTLNKYTWLKQVPGILFLLWSVMGYLSTHSNLFFSILCVIIFFRAFIIFFMLLALFSKSDKKVEPKYKINVSFIENGIKLIIVSCILYSHFFISPL